MKTSSFNTIILTLFAVALVAAPAALRAADSTNAPAAGSEAAPKHKHNEHSVLPFHGKLTAIDQDAMTLTVGERTFKITSETKITKDNVPATLADGVVGEMVGGAYKKNTDGKLTATMIHFGVAGGEKKSTTKKKTGASHGESETNNPAN